MIDPGLAGRTVLVTGGNNPEGIGAALVRAFAAQGAKVFLTYRREPPPPPPSPSPSPPGPARYAALQTADPGGLVEEILRSGGEAAAWEADLADAAAIPQLFRRTEESLGPADVLVHNAAHCAADTFLPQDDLPAVSAELHDRHFAVNSRAAALLMAEFARRHLARGATRGRIINISTDGASGHAGAVSYGASKHALESYSRAAAWELGRLGITVNVIAPGPVQTGWIPAEQEEALAARIPLRRIGTPEDIADVAVFLASEQARWVTGQVIYVGGGNVMPL